MIRFAKIDDAAEIADIYNVYVTGTVVSFETVPVSVEEMERRITDISAEYPYLVAEDGDGHITGYCYAHPWKARAAYSQTLETTVYLRSDSIGCGLGRQLMERLTEECRAGGFHALIACITAENRASIEFHRKLGFKKVSQFQEVGYKFGRRLDVVDMELLL